MANFNYEKAHVNIWNHMLTIPGFRELVVRGDFGRISRAIQSEITTAHHNRNHPLHYTNSGEGKDYRSYTKALNNSKHGLTSMLNNRAGKNMFIKGSVAEHSGSKHQKSKSNWKGQTSGQGRSDIIYRNPNNPKFIHRQSLKLSGGSQAMSGGGSQLVATINSAIKTLTKDRNIRLDVNEQAVKIKNLSDSMKGKSGLELQRIKTQQQTLINNLI